MRSGSVNKVSVLHYAGLKPWSGRANIGRESLQAFDAAMASYRRRCHAAQPALTDPERLFRDAVFQRRHSKGSGGRGGKGVNAGTRIHLRDMYAYGSQ